MQRGGVNDPDHHEEVGLLLHPGDKEEQFGYSGIYWREYLGARF